LRPARQSRAGFFISAAKLSVYSLRVSDLVRFVEAGIRTARTSLTRLACPRKLGRLLREHAVARTAPGRRNRLRCGRAWFLSPSCASVRSRMFCMPVKFSWVRSSLEGGFRHCDFHWGVARSDQERAEFSLQRAVPERDRDERRADCRSGNHFPWHAPQACHSVHRSSDLRDVPRSPASDDPEQTGS
jgi:hypothetical protein